jgi:hypothetical protein
MGIWAAILLAPLAVHAQIQAPRESAPLELGPVSVYPTFQITDAGKDTNVFNDESAAKEDFTFTAASRVIAVTKFGPNELLFMSGQDYVWFQQYASERAANTRYAARLNLTASEFKPYVGLERIHTRVRPNPEIDARALRLEQSAVAGFDWNLADRTAITSSIRIDSFSYDKGQRYKGSNLAEELNRSGHSASLGLRYAITPLTSISFAGEYSEDTFEESHSRDARSYSLAPGVEFSPDAMIRGRFRAGVKKFEPFDKSLASYFGPTFEGSVSWSMFSHTNVTLIGGRNTQYSYRETEPYYIMSGGRLSLSQHLFGPVDFLAATERQHLTYRWHRDSSISTDALDPDNTLLEFSTGVSVYVGRGFKFSVGAERTTRLSPADPGQNFRRTRLLSSVTIGS